MCYLLHSGEGLSHSDTIFLILIDGSPLAILSHLTLNNSDEGKNIPSCNYPTSEVCKDSPLYSCAKPIGSQLHLKMKVINGNSLENDVVL